MTPDIRAACKLTSDPARVTWFDAGKLPEYNPEELLHQDRLMHIPFDRCAVCGRDADGDLFVLALFSMPGKNVAVSGCTRTPRGMVDLQPFSYMVTDYGIKLHQTQDLDTARRAIVIIHWWLERMDSKGATAYTATPKTNTLNRQRMARGKPPLSYDWSTVVIDAKPQSTASHGGTHASPRAHDRRGHWRTYPSGKRGWVNACKVGDASLGAVFKDYKVITS